MEHLQAYNRKLLENILPVHVAEHFLSRDKNIDVSIQDLVTKFIMKFDKFFIKDCVFVLKILYSSSHRTNPINNYLFPKGRLEKYSKLINSILSTHICTTGAIKLPGFTCGWQLYLIYGNLCWLARCKVEVKSEHSQIIEL